MDFEMVLAPKLNFLGGDSFCGGRLGFEEGRVGGFLCIPPIPPPLVGRLGGVAIYLLKFGEGLLVSLGLEIHICMYEERQRKLKAGYGLKIPVKRDNLSKCQQYYFF